MSEIIKPRILRFEIEEEDAGKTIKEYLMRKVGFSSKQLSRFKYRKDGILLNGEKRYVNVPMQAEDVLEMPDLTYEYADEMPASFIVAYRMYRMRTQEERKAALRKAILSL